MKCLDFHEDKGWWKFRFGGGDDFFEALDSLKLAVPFPERRYYPEQNHLWAVLKTDENRETLIDVFANGKQCIEIVEKSPRLPGFEPWPLGGRES